MTPTAEDLKAELLLHGVKPPTASEGSGKGRAHSVDLDGPVSFLTIKTHSPGKAAQPAAVAFPQASSCPPDFWGEPSVSPYTMYMVAGVRCKLSKTHSLGLNLCLMIPARIMHSTVPCGPANPMICTFSALYFLCISRVPINVGAGDEKGQELCAQRPAKSMDDLLDTLLDMSVAALVDPNVNVGCGVPIAAVTPEALPMSFRSPFDQPDR